MLADVPMAVSPLAGEAMRGGRAMILRTRVQCARDYDIGDEIWRQSLAGVIAAEAETIAGHAG